MGNSIVVGASEANPRPENAFFTTGVKPTRVTTTVGMPSSISICAAARPAAVPHPPQPALPVMTASHFAAFTLWMT